MTSRFLALALCLPLAPALAAQEKDKVTQGQIKFGVHKFKLEKDFVYQFNAKGKDFSPRLDHYDDTQAPVRVGIHMFMPAKNSEHTVVVSQQSIVKLPAEGVLDYALTMTKMKLDEKPLLKKEDKLTAEDAKRGMVHFKAYPLQVKAGQVLAIDMVASNAPGNALHPFLTLEGPDNKFIAFDIDGGGPRFARIIYTAAKEGEYRIVASTNAPQALGDYTLTVRTASASKEKDKVIDGQIKFGVHKFKLEAGSVTDFEVKGLDQGPRDLRKHFSPQITHFDGTGTSKGKGNRPDPDIHHVAAPGFARRFIWMPAKNLDATLVISQLQHTPPPDGLLDYTLRVNSLQLDETSVLKKEDKLTAEDPKYMNKRAIGKAQFKAYPLKVEEGRLYVITMEKSKEAGNKLDPHLYLEDPDGKILLTTISKDSSRIVFLAYKEAREFRIIASTWANRDIGDYILTVSTIKEK